MASYGRVIARFKGFQSGYRVKGTVEFVPKSWCAEAGAIFAPVPVVGYVREDGALYPSEIFYSESGEAQAEGILLLTSPVESGVVEYIVTPRLYDPRTGFAVTFRAFTLRVAAGATVDLAGVILANLTGKAPGDSAPIVPVTPVDPSPGVPPTPSPVPVPPPGSEHPTPGEPVQPPTPVDPTPVPPTPPVPPAPSPRGEVRLVSSADGVWSLELPDGATITTDGRGEYVPSGVNTAHTGNGNYLIGE